MTGSRLHGSRLSWAGCILGTFLLALSCFTRRIGREVGAWICSTYHRGWGLRTLALSRVHLSQGEGVRGEVHENGAEGIFSLLPPDLAVFRGVSNPLLPAYLGFFQFVRNHRELTAWQQAEVILRQGLDPTLTQAAKEGRFAQPFLQSLQLHSAAR